MKTAIIILLFAFKAFSMDRWDALAMEESGTDDSAIGQAGEVSRYQVLPEVWKRCTNSIAWDASNPAKNVQLIPTNPKQANFVAWLIMFQRDEQFQKTYHRAPTDLEWALLWKCPSRVNNPTKQKLEQAQRVANLINRKETK